MTEPERNASHEPPITGPGGVVPDQYVLLEKLSASRTGLIFKAQHRLMGRIVAVKFLSDEAAGSKMFAARFHRAIQILGRLEHRNLVKAFEAGEQGGTHYLVMEYVDGRDLRSIIKENGPLGIEEAVRYAIQAAAGMATAHEQGVCHRNIKPSNLLLDRAAAIKIVGFTLAHVEAGGAAAEAGVDDNLTRQGQAIGTYEYMSPEQAMDSSSVDRRADIYSLGCTLFMLLTGRPPYVTKPGMQQVLAHRAQPIPSLCQARRDVHDALDRVFQKMVAKTPGGRYASMEEVIADLEASVTAPATIEARRASEGSAPDEAARKLKKRKTKSGLRMVPLVVGGALGVLAFVFVANYFQGKKPAAVAKTDAPSGSGEKTVAPARVVEQPFVVPAERHGPMVVGGGNEKIPPKGGTTNAGNMEKIPPKGGTTNAEPKSWPAKADALADASKAAKQPLEHWTVAQQALVSAQKAVEAGQFDVAGRLSELAVTEAGKAEDPRTSARIRSMVGEVQKAVTMRREYDAAKEKLKGNPQDPPANLVAGRYECLIAEKWNDGLKKLAAGSDDALRELATKDLAQPEDTQQQAGIGDGWWDLAEAESGDTQTHAYRRAGVWYEKASSRASGPLKAKIRERLETIHAGEGA